MRGALLFLVFACALRAGAGEAPCLDLQALLRPETRLQAWRAFCESDPRHAQLAEIPAFPHLEVTPLPRPEGPPHYLVSWRQPRPDRWPDEPEPAAGPLVPKGETWCELFSSRGQTLSGSPEFIESGFLAEIRGAGTRDVVQSFSLDPDGQSEPKPPKRQRVDYLIIHPANDPAPTFAVVYNAHTVEAAAEENWSFRLVPRTATSPAALQLGPQIGLAGLQPAVTFTWSTERERWEGPEAKPGDHFRVLPLDNPDEAALNIARAGGLGYPVALAAAATIEPPPEEPAQPWRYHSLAGLSDEAIFAFMNVRRAGREFGAMAAAPRRPERFWEMDPKEAALAYARAGLQPAAERSLRLGYPETSGAKPPAEGDVVLAASWQNEPHAWQLHCGPQESWLAMSVFSQVVRDKPFQPDPVGEIRRVELPAPVARHALQTVWWLSRIRARRLASDRADLPPSLAGNIAAGSLRLFSPEGTSCFECAATGVGSALGDYQPGDFLSLALQLFTLDLPVRLGESLDEPSVIRHEGGVFRTLSEEQIAQMQASAAELLDLAAEGRVSPAALGPVLEIVGACGWQGLRPALERLAARLPPPSPAEARLAGFDARLRRQRLALGWEPTAEAAIAYRNVRRRIAGYEYSDGDSQASEQIPEIQPLSFREAQSFDEFDAWYAGRPALEHAGSLPERDLAGVRTALRVVLRKLADWDQPAALYRWAREDPALLLFAVARLEALESPLAAELLERGSWHVNGLAANGGFAEESERLRAAAAHGNAGDPAREASTASGATLAGELLERLLDPEAEPEARARALEALVPPTEPGRFADPAIDAALLELLRHPPEESPALLRSLYLSAAQRLGGRAWDLLEKPLMPNQQISWAGDILPALVVIARQEAEPFRGRLREEVTGRLLDHPEEADELLWAVWQLDLRALEPQVELRATAGVEEQEQEEAPPGQVRRSHSARCLAALWKEEDPLTRARLLVAWAASQAAFFENPRIVAHERLRLELAAGCAALSAEGRVAVQKFITWCEARTPGETDLLFQEMREAVGR